jgi:hypothetical protein
MTSRIGHCQSPLDELRETSNQPALSRTAAWWARSIKERIEAGAGLLIVEGFGHASRFVDLRTLEEVDDDHCLRAGIPWGLMPEKILESVQVEQLGGQDLAPPLDLVANRPTRFE